MTLSAGKGKLRSKSAQTAIERGRSARRRRTAWRLRYANSHSVWDQPHEPHRQTPDDLHAADPK